MTTTILEASELDVLQQRLQQEYERHTQHLADLSSDPQGHHDGGLTANLAHASREALVDIARALKAADEGRYGVCIACGDSIPVERLQLRPQAKHCVPCT